jgi:hypothetical protein
MELSDELDDEAALLAGKETRRGLETICSSPKLIIEPTRPKQKLYYGLTK